MFRRIGERSLSWIDFETVSSSSLVLFVFFIYFLVIFDHSVLLSADCAENLSKSVTSGLGSLFGR